MFILKISKIQFSRICAEPKVKDNKFVGIASKMRKRLVFHWCSLTFKGAFINTAFVISITALKTVLPRNNILIIFST